MSALDAIEKMDSVQVAQLAGKVSGEGALTDGLSKNQQNAALALLAQRQNQHKIIGALAAMARSGQDLSGGEGNDEVTAERLIEGEAEVKKVQNEHHLALLKLAKALQKAWKYSEEVATKSINSGKGISGTLSKVGRDSESELSEEKRNLAQNGVTERLKAKLKSMDASLDGLGLQNEKDDREMSEQLADVQKLKDLQSSTAAQEAKTKAKIRDLEGEMGGSNTDNVKGHDYVELKGKLTSVMDLLGTVKTAEASESAKMKQLYQEESDSASTFSRAQSSMGPELSRATVEQQRASRELADESAGINRLIAQERSLERKAHSLTSEADSDLKRSNSMSESLGGAEERLTKANGALGVQGQKIGALTRETKREDQILSQAEWESKEDEEEAHELYETEDGISKSQKSMDQQTKELFSTGSDIVDKLDTQEQILKDAKARANEKIKTVKQLASGNDAATADAVTSVGQNQKSTDKQLQALNSAVSSSISSEKVLKDEEAQLADHERKLKDHEKNMASREAQIDANTKAASQMTTTFMGIMVLMAVVLGALHNTWRGKLEQLESKRNETEAAAALAGGGAEEDWGGAEAEAAAGEQDPLLQN